MYQNQHGLGRDNGARLGNRSLLSTHCNYHPTTDTQFDSSVGRPAAKFPAFHKLSSEFLGAETSRDYVAELVFFILITGIAIWPITSMLVAVARLIRNY